MNTETYLPFYERRKRAHSRSSSCERFYDVGHAACESKPSRPSAPELPFYRRHLPVTEKVVLGVVGAGSGVVAASFFAFMCAAIYLLGCAVLVGTSNGGAVLAGH